MRLPEDAIISMEKLTSYLLTEQPRGDKSRFLGEAGYTRANPEQLEGDLRWQILVLDAVPLPPRGYGELYEIRGGLAWAERGRVARSNDLDARACDRLGQVHHADSSEERTAMKFQWYKQVALARDVPEDGLREGDIATVVDHHPSPKPGGEDGYSLEIFNAVGDTIVVTVVPGSAIEALREDQVFSVRPLAKTA